MRRCWFPLYTPTVARASPPLWVWDLQAMAASSSSCPVTSGCLGHGTGTGTGTPGMGTPGAGTPIGGIGTPVGGGVHTPATEFSSSVLRLARCSEALTRPVGGIATPVGLGPSKHHRTNQGSSIHASEANCPRWYCDASGGHRHSSRWHCYWAAGVCMCVA